MKAMMKVFCHQSPLNVQKTSDRPDIDLDVYSRANLGCLDTTLRQSIEIFICIHRELTYKQKKMYFLVKMKKKQNKKTIAK